MRTNLAILAVAAAVSVQWPLDLPQRYLTANFMEYRDGRFHAGIDLKTNSQTGYPCHAVEAGSVVRIRTGAWGYGKAVYLLGDSGRTYVYGHVERFADRLRERERAAQEKAGRYAMDLELAPGVLRVARGEVLALSGQTGTGGPHLHFEVRDQAGDPIDPQGAGFAVPDKIAPRIQRLRAVPAAPEAAVAGQATAWVARPGGGAVAELAVRGPVAFSADVVEISDAMNHKLAPARLTLTVDDDVVFESRNERIDWASVGHIRYEFLDCDGVRERWLHRRPEDAVPGRRGGEWFRRLAPGRHRLELTAGDHAGNTSRVAWTLVVLGRDDPWPKPAVGWTVAPIGARFAGDDALVPPLGAPRQAPAGERLRAPFPLWWRPVAEAPSPTLPSGLVLAGPAAEYLAADWTAAGAVPVPLPAGAEQLADDPRAGVYRRAGNAWAYVGPVRDFGLRRPGLHAVLRDTLGPVIVVRQSVVAALPGPRRVAAAVTPPRFARVEVPVGDHGSGVDWDRVTTWLDGVRLIAEPDAPRAQLLIELPDDLAPGDHALGIEAWDVAGNLTTRNLTVRVGR